MIAGRENLPESGIWHVVPLGSADIPEAVALFHATVHAVNACDYSPAQLDAWAPDDDEHRRRLAEKLGSQRLFGVRENGLLVGFGSLDCTGELDMLYVSEKRQGLDIATALAAALEQEACTRGWRVLRTFASLTARPFFESRGYSVVRENIAVRRGIELKNFLMEKPLT